MVTQFVMQYRQISRDKAEKPDEACYAHKNDTQKSESDARIQQEHKRFEDNLQKKTNKSMNNCASSFHHADKLSESVAKSMKGTTDRLAEEQSVLKANSCATGNYIYCKECHKNCAHQIIRLIM